MPTLVGDFLIDCTVSMEPNHSAEITRFPIGRGAPATDHRILNPTTLTLELIVTDTPLPEIAARRESNLLPSQAANEYMLNLHLQSQVISITTDRGNYDDMMLESYTPTFDASTGKALKWTAKFVAVVFVDLLRFTLTIASSTAGKKKSSRPPVQYFTKDEDGNIITKSGRIAVPNKDGLLEYADAAGKPSGKIVPDSDFVTPPKSTDTDVEGPFWSETREEWFHLDNSPVTQEQIEKGKAKGYGPDAKPVLDDSKPWYDNVRGSTTLFPTD